MERDNVVYLNLGRNRKIVRRPAKVTLKQFIPKDEHPELFGEEDKFGFEMEDDSEEGIMDEAEFKKKLSDYREKVAKEKGTVVCNEASETFEITEE